MVSAWNRSQTRYILEPLERLAQLVIVPVVQAHSMWCRILPPPHGGEGAMVPRGRRNQRRVPRCVFVGGILRSDRALSGRMPGHCLAPDVCPPMFQCISTQAVVLTIEGVTTRQKIFPEWPSGLASRWWLECCPHVPPSSRRPLHPIRRSLSHAGAPVAAEYGRVTNIEMLQRAAARRIHGRRCHSGRCGRRCVGGNQVGRQWPRCSHSGRCGRCGGRQCH